MLSVFRHEKLAVHPFLIVGRSGGWQIRCMTTTKLFDRLLTPVFCAGLLWVFTLCGKGATASAADIPQPTQESSLARQEFYCSPGYGLAECQQHVSKLKSLLAQYSGGTQLPWSWYIVRSEDWEPLLQKAHLGRLTPAFTGLEGRKTYLEESLFLPPSKRGNELEHDFGVPFDKLLSLAVAHELGHAVCRD